MEKGNDNQAEIKELSQKIVKILPLGLILWEENEPSETIKNYIAEQILSLLSINWKRGNVDNELFLDLWDYVDKYRWNIYQIIGKLAEVGEFRTQLWILYSREKLRQLRKEVEKTIVWIREKQNR